MREDYTHITLVIDRSGSMQQVWKDVSGWYESLIQQHKQAIGKCTFTVVAFDSEIKTMQQGQNVKKMPKYLDVHPRGMTRLLDAIGTSIQATDKYIKKMPKERRPGKVLFMIQTDGLENNSKNFNKDKVTEMIGEKSDDWEFMFLGARIEAIRDAHSWGIANTVNYNEQKTRSALELSTTKTLDTRSASMDTYKAAYVVTPNEERGVQ